MTPQLYLIVAVHVCISVVGMANTPPIPKFSSIIIFGDSLVDTGNNMYMKSWPIGDHLPYGRDFPTHKPTGRLSNGKLVPDFLASALNLTDAVPPYLDPKLSNKELLTAVCFASAASGLDEVTGAVLKVISMSKQIEYFKDYKARLKYIVGEDETTQILGNALVIIAVASNDFILNFYNIPVRRLMFSIDEYQDYLLVRLQNFIKDLYNLGCRKFGISGLGPIGCIPLQITSKFRMNRTQCAEEQNTDSEQYNKKLVQLLTQMQAMLLGSKLVYIDLFYTTFDLLNHPTKYGMEVTDVGCCSLITIEAGPFCNEFTPVCEDASKYVFWDAFHFTEASYFYLSKYVEKEVLPQFNFY